MLVAQIRPPQPINPYIIPSILDEEPGFSSKIDYGGDQQNLEDETIKSLGIEKIETKMTTPVGSRENEAESSSSEIDF